jgi:hypothetical protein
MTANAKARENKPGSMSAPMKASGRKIRETVKESSQKKGKYSKGCGKKTSLSKSKQADRVRVTMRLHLSELTT